MKSDSVILFRSKNNLDASKNLKEFIRFCKNDLIILDSDIEWEHNEWKGIAIFCKMHEKIYTSNNDGKWLDSEFIDFAKAYTQETSRCSF
ncbi:hypothetical protein [Photorhabdus laumondii]|uniref:hypothetical protein n=1 Tax=Photorhabdus laumondii TaxID=2218628 RepID=UPI0025B1D001|nr:hypothetical protein [Photorhabdus laumondii]